MDKPILFATKEDFRQYLEGRNGEGPGVWLLFGKKGGPATLTAKEALEEALCCGWIDGQMKKLDEVSYIKYFAPRGKSSKWSDKNKALAADLEAAGRMGDLGRAAIQMAKEAGGWDHKKAPAVTEEDVAAVMGLLAGQEPALTHYKKMSPSVQRTYARAYFDAKTEAGREKRLAWMVDRLNQNLKPM